MNDAYLQFCRAKGIGRYTEVVEAIKREDDAQLRRARILNGAEPEFQNGHPKDQEKGRTVPRKKKGGRKGY